MKSAAWVHRTIVAPITLWLMWVSGNWSTEVFHYVVLSTGYAILWLTKVTRRAHA